MAWRYRMQEIRGRLSRKVAIVEARAVPGKKNFRPERTGKGRAGRIFSGPARAEKLIRHAALGDMKNDTVSCLGMIENEVRRRGGAIAFVVEVVAVDEKDSLPGQKQHESQCRREHPPGMNLRQSHGRQDQQRRQAENHVSSQEHRASQRQQDGEPHRKHQQDQQEVCSPDLPASVAGPKLRAEPNQCQQAGERVERQERPTVASGQMLEKFEHIASAGSRNPANGTGASFGHKNQRGEGCNPNDLPCPANLPSQTGSVVSWSQIGPPPPAQNDPVSHHQQQGIEVRVHRQNAGHNIGDEIVLDWLANPRHQRARGGRSQQHQQSVAAGFLRVADAVGIERE